MKTLYALVSLLLFFTSSVIGQIRVRSTATGGDWSCSCTWEGGIAPEPVDTAEIIAGSTVVIDSAEFGATKIAAVALKGTLRFGVNEPLVVSGDLNVYAGGILNAFNGSTGALVKVQGNLINNGTVDFSKTGTVLTMGENQQATNMSGTGTYGVIRQLTIDNPKNVQLSSALSISSKLELTRGILLNNAVLTFDQTNIGNGTTSASCTIQRSPFSSLGSAITLPAATVLYVVYAGNEGEGSITEGYEIPASRAIHKIVAGNPDGVLITNDLTLKTSSAAITLTSGVITVAAGKTLICNNSGFMGTAGTYNSYVDGGVALTTNAAGGTKTFPVGAAGRSRKVVLNELSAATGALVVRFVIVPASGGTGANGIVLSPARRFYGTVISGSPGKYTGMSIDYWDDDAISQQTAMIASSSTLGGSYSNMGTGTNTATAVLSAAGLYDNGLPGYYSLASPAMPLAAKKAADDMIVVHPDNKKGTILMATVYPNPTRDEISIKTNGLKGDQAKLIITNVSGQVVYRGTAPVSRLESGHIVSLKKSGLNTGIYFLEVVAEGRSNSARFLVL